jgi:ribonuclease P protein component
MLRKKERLNRETFNRFFSIGKRVHSPIATLVYSPHPTFHASVVVSKKIDSRAVRRNKLRRQAYDIVRNHTQAEPINGVFIIILKPPVVSVGFEELKKEIHALITNIPPSVTKIT